MTLWTRIRVFIRWLGLLWQAASRPEIAALEVPPASESGSVLDQVAAIAALENSALGRAAKQAVQQIEASPELQRAAVVEPRVSCCPRCGQIPTGDRRLEEARECALELLGEQPGKISELNFALEYFHFINKNLKGG
jgi:hypothetical protein